MTILSIVEIWYMVSSVPYHPCFPSATFTLAVEVVVIMVIWCCPSLMRVIHRVPDKLRLVHDKLTTRLRQVHDKESQPVDQLQFCPRHVHDLFTTSSRLVRDTFTTAVVDLSGTRWITHITQVEFCLICWSDSAVCTTRKKLDQINIIRSLSRKACRITRVHMTRQHCIQIESIEKFHLPSLDGTDFHLKIKKMTSRAGVVL
jgi:hypothetical protein